MSASGFELDVVVLRGLGEGRRPEPAPSATSYSASGIGTPGAYAGGVQPVPRWESPWDGHILLAYDSEAARRAGVVAWMGRGLQLGAKLLYVEHPDEPRDRSLDAVLSEVRGEFALAVETGQVQVLDLPEETLDPAWLTTVLAEALGAGYPSVRLSVEASAAWTVTSPPEHLEIERAADSICNTAPVSVMCQYSTRVTESALEHAWSVHSAGLRESLLETVPIPTGVAVAGEVDRSNERVLRSVLAAAILRELGTFVVDLSRLRFLDLSGVRALVTATEAHRRHGGVVRLLEPRPAVDHLLRLLGLDRTDGFILEGA